MTYENPILTVDVVMLTLLAGRLHVALAPRPANPYAGLLALPGGYVHTNEDADTEATARRVLREKLKFEPSHLEQLHTVSGRDRDPRGWSSSVVYLALYEVNELKPLRDAGAIVLLDAEKTTLAKHELAFDHAKLIEGAVARLRAKAAYSTIAAHLLPTEFTLSELREVMEAVLKRSINPANFRRKMLELDALEPVTIQHGIGRPAQAFTLKADLNYFDRLVA